MGLPFWPGTDGDEPPGWSGAPEPEGAAEALATLANSDRLAVLATLHEEGPLSYTDLRTAVDVEDKGRFNYHLRQLDGLVEGEDGTYALSERGERVVRRVLASRELATGE